MITSLNHTIKMCNGITVCHFFQMLLQVLNATNSRQTSPTSSYLLRLPFDNFTMSICVTVDGISDKLLPVTGMDVPSVRRGCHSNDVVVCAFRTVSFPHVCPCATRRTINWGERHCRDPEMSYFIQHPPALRSDSPRTWHRVAQTDWRSGSGAHREPGT